MFAQVVELVIVVVALKHTYGASVSKVSKVSVSVLKVSLSPRSREHLGRSRLGLGPQRLVYITAVLATEFAMKSVSRSDAAILFRAGPPGIPVFKRKIPPRQRKKFPFGKMLDFTRSNTISTQTSNINLNQLQRYGQFAEVYMLLEVLSLEIYPNVSVTNSFPSVPHVETYRQRSITVVSTNAPRPDRRPPDIASP